MQTNETDFNVLGEYSKNWKFQNSGANKVLFTVDPSISSLGYAIFFDGDIISAGHIKQNTSTKENYRIRAVSMSQILLGTIKTYIETFSNVELTMVIEAQSNWGSAKGSAAKDSESIQKLYFATGLYIQAIMSLPQTVEIKTIEPIKWKGQAPKDVMVRRAHAYVPSLEKCPHDTCEAVLIGKFALNFPDNEGFDLVYQKGQLNGSFNHRNFI